MSAKQNNHFLPDDFLTLAALGTGAFIIADLAHEAIGHGGMCLATGGSINLITSVYFQCSPKNILTDAAGSLVNLVAGILFFLVLHIYKNASPTMRLFLALSGAFNLFWIAANLIYSGAANIDDGAFVIEGLQPAWLWRSLLLVVGLVIYYFSMRLLASSVQPLVSIDEPFRGKRVKRLFLIPYLAAGTAEGFAAAFDRHNPLLSVKDAFLETFCAFVGYLVVTFWLSRHQITELLPYRRIERQIGLIISVVVLLIIFTITMGRGISMHSFILESEKRLR